MSLNFDNNHRTSSPQEVLPLKLKQHPRVDCASQSRISLTKKQTRGRDILQARVVIRRVMCKWLSEGSLTLVSRQNDGKSIPFPTGLNPICRCLLLLDVQAP